MVNDILESAAVGKLRGILKSRYGKSLRVSFMQEVSSLEIAEEDTFLLSRGDLHIPIQVNDKYLATAVVEQGADLKSEDQKIISQLVRLFMEPEIFNWYVEQMTHNMNSVSSSNIVKLQRPDPEISNKTASTTNVLCLQAKNPHLIPRMAQNIHEVSERWAYLKFSDVENEIRTAEDLKSLGSLTLFIEDILQLSPESQSLLHTYLSNSSPADEPLVVIGVTTGLEELQDNDMIHEGLAKILKVHRIEVERMPRDPKQLQETLEIMLEF